MKAHDLVKQLRITISKMYKRNEIQYPDLEILQHHLDRFVDDMNNSVEYVKVTKHAAE